MSIYAAIAERASRTIAKKGAPVVFRGAGAQTYHPLTDTWTAGASDVAAYTASAVQADPQHLEDALARLAALNIVLTNPATLFVAARYQGTLIPRPAPNMVFTWAGAPFTVRDVQTLAPDGAPIAYTVTGSR